MTKSIKAITTNNKEVDFELETKIILKSLKSYLKKNFGEQCSDYADGCGNCRLWHAYKILEERLEDLI